MSVKALRNELRDLESEIRNCEALAPDEAGLGLPQVLARVKVKQDLVHLVRLSKVRAEQANDRPEMTELIEDAISDVRADVSDDLNWEAQDLADRSCRLARQAITGEPEERAKTQLDPYLAQIADLSQEISACKALATGQRSLSDKAVFKRIQLRSAMINLLDLSANSVLGQHKPLGELAALRRDLREEIRLFRNIYYNTRSKAARDLAMRCYSLAYKVLTGTRPKSS